MKSREEKSRREKSRREKSRREKSRREKSRREKSRREKSRRETEREPVRPCNFHTLLISRCKADQSKIKNNENLEKTKKITRTTKKTQVWREYPSQNPKTKKTSRKPKKNKKKTKVWREYLRQNPKTQKTSRKPKKQKNKGLERISQATFPSGDFFFCFLFFVFFLFSSILGFYRTVCRFFPVEACLIVFIVMVGSLHHFSQHQSKPSFKEIWFRV